MIEWLALIGVVLNFVGTLFLAYSFGPALDGYQTDDKGRSVKLAAFVGPRRFRWGLILIGLGFALQVPSAAKAVGLL